MAQFSIQENEARLRSQQRSDQRSRQRRDAAATCGAPVGSRGRWPSRRRSKRS